MNAQIDYELLHISDFLKINGTYVKTKNGITGNIFACSDMNRINPDVLIEIDKECYYLGGLKINKSQIQGWHFLVDKAILPNKIMYILKNLSQCESLKLKNDYNDCLNCGAKGAEPCKNDCPNQ